LVVALLHVEMRSGSRWWVKHEGVNGTVPGTASCFNITHLVGGLLLREALAVQDLPLNWAAGMVRGGSGLLGVCVLLVLDEFLHSHCIIYSVYKRIFYRTMRPL